MINVIIAKIYFSPIIGKTEKMPKTDVLGALKT